MRKITWDFMVQLRHLCAIRDLRAIPRAKINDSGMTCWQAFWPNQSLFSLESSWLCRRLSIVWIEQPTFTRLGKRSISRLLGADPRRRSIRLIEVVWRSHLLV
jgi:hypothetical protein